MDEWIIIGIVLLALKAIEWLVTKALPIYAYKILEDNSDE